MPNNTHSELMTTHAGRSLLEETKRFSNEGKAVGEYVKNSWQYSDEVDHNPTVEIMINQENKSIQIKDDSKELWYQVRDKVKELMEHHNNYDYAI